MPSTFVLETELLPGGAFVCATGAHTTGARQPEAVSTNIRFYKTTQQSLKFLFGCVFASSTVAAVLREGRKGEQPCTAPLSVGPWGPLHTAHVSGAG